MNKWYSGEGNNSDVVMSSRIRLARNLEDAPFPCRMSRDIRKSTVKKIFAAIKNSPFAGDFDLIDLSSMSEAQAVSYAEKQLISPEFANNRENASFLLSKDESVSIMLCEEDHIRLAAMEAGQNLAAAYARANELDDVFIKNLKIAFDEKLGFLTSVPTNLGTGMKASFDLHLPAIKQRDMIGQLSVTVGKLGLSLRPLFGSNGAFYRLSNQVTLGITEQSAIDNMNAICDQIVKQERNLREMLANREEFEDKVYRAMGTLLMARKLSTAEFFELLSLVRVGISMGYCEKSYKDIGELIQTVQTATVIAASDADITADTAAKIRAGLVREKLK